MTSLSKKYSDWAAKKTKKMRKQRQLGLPQNKKRDANKASENEWRTKERAEQCEKVAFSPLRYSITLTNQQHKHFKKNGRKKGREEEISRSTIWSRMDDFNEHVSSVLAPSTQSICAHTPAPAPTPTVNWLGNSTCLSPWLLGNERRG